MSADVISTIRAHYEGLSRTQRAIADYILQHADTACFLSLKELARATCTCETTILSFCAKTGHDGFVGLKRELQEYLRRWVTPSEKIRLSASQLEGEQKPLQRVMEREQQSLSQTFRYLNLEEFDRFVAALAGAEHIHVVGHGVSAPVAMFLQLRLQQIGLRVGGLNVLDHRAVVYEAARAGQRDVFVIVAFPNYAPQTVALVDYLSTVDATTLCITDRASSPVTHNARAVLLCDSQNVIFYNSITAAMALANLVTSAIVLADHPRFAAHIDKLDEIEAYLLSAQVAYRDELGVARSKSI